MNLKISGIEGYDGDYEFDFDDFTQRELAEGEAMAKVPFAKWDDGYISVVVAVAALVLRRSGKPVVEDMLWSGKPGSIQVLRSGADVGPPGPLPTLLNDGDLSSSALSDTGSGLESLDGDLSGTGSPGSETSVVSVPETLET